MADTFTADKILARLQEVGANENTWGGLLNTNVIEYIAAAVADYRTITINTSSAGTTTLSAAEARSAMLKITGAMVANGTMQVPAAEGGYRIWNATTGGFAITVRTPAGSGVSVAQDTKPVVWCDGTDVIAAGGTAAGYDTGTSGAKVPLLNGANTFSAVNTFSAGIIFANETLGTYDEGTWTAAWQLGSGSITSYTNQTMAYTRIGRMCHVAGGLYVNAVSTPGGNDTRLTGLPFTVGQAGGGVYMNPPLEILPRGFNAALTTSIKLAALSGQTYASLYLYAATGGMTETGSGTLLNQASNSAFIGGAFYI